MTGGRRATLAAIALLAGAMVALAVVAGTGGAGAQEPEIQTTAETIAPDPHEARGDRGRPERCPSRTELGSKLRCIYGKRRSSTNVVVWGDSKVMQYFPALNHVAHRRNWRLVGLMRAGCPPMTIRRYAYRCDKWRERNLRRLRRIDPELIVTSSSVAYQVVRRGKRLSRKRSRGFLRRAYIRTLRDFRRRGAKVVVVINPPRAPENPVTCVIANREALDVCAFERGPEPYHTYVAKAARRARAQRLDINQVACPGAICPAVANDILVFRDRVHLTATYVRSIVDWIDERLPALD